jgi:hypothetical protein
MTEIGDNVVAMAIFTTSDSDNTVCDKVVCSASELGL